MPHGRTVLYMGLSLGIFAPTLAAATAPDTLSLDGDGHLVVPDHPALNPTGGLTVEAWIRPTRLSDFPTVVGKQFTDSYWLGLVDDGTLRAYASGSTTLLNGHALGAPIGRWTHVAMTFDGTTQRLYVDGVLDVEEDTPAPLAVSDWPLAIGADADGRFPFAGSLAEVRIWDTALNQASIQQNLVRQIARHEPGLVASWSLESSPEDTLGTHDGILVGTASFGGPPAPPNPTTDGALHIPRLGDEPTFDGHCAIGEYGSTFYPLYLDHPSTDIYRAYVGATAHDVWICVDDVWQDADAHTAVFVDLDGSGGPHPTADDLRIRITTTGVQSLESGDGTGALSPAPWADGDAEAMNTVAAEFTHDQEFRIARSLLANSPFGLQLTHDTGDIGTFPVGSEPMRRKRSS